MNPLAADNDPQQASREADRARSARRRWRGLIAAHLLLTATPNLVAWTVPDASDDALKYAQDAITLGQASLLTIVAGLGPRGRRRLWYPVLGAAYLGAWYGCLAASTSVLGSASGRIGSTSVFIGDATVTIGNTTFSLPPIELVMIGGMTFTMLLVLIGLGGMLIGLFCLTRWQLRPFAEPPALAGDGGSQWTIKHLLTITAAAAVLMAGARLSGQADASGAWIIPYLAVYLGALVTAVGACLWSTLTVGRWEWRVVLALLATAYLGMIISVGTPFQATPLLSWSSLAAVPPALLVIASLLVARSCGLRLVPLPKVLRRQLLRQLTPRGLPPR